SVLKALHEQIREDKMEKTYVTLLKGRISEKRVKINEPLRKFVTKSGERMVKVSDDGKPSVTLFFPKQVFDYPNSGSTLVDVKLITGRTHQIRVHSLHFDHPVAGDDKYGDEYFNSQMKEIGLKRMFLHARSLRFVHPVSGEIMNPVAPMDKQLTSVIDSLSESGN
ncbi:MAG: pseudouridine synthase, partial [Gammaproteobacteria bacterium]|nr:pseudouridine synthase [Gammaproteobacteria bacterium]